MGFNTIHLLPITSIGSDGNKGTLGSPYAIKNPYELDRRLAEPCLELDVNAQFEAFVEAAHRFGMRVVVEFVFRTASKDSDWIREHPEWFYWIDASVADRDPSDPDKKGYGNPVFDDKTLKLIKKQVEKDEDYTDLPPPPEGYRAIFSDPPQKVVLRDGRFIGKTAGGKEVRIPGAFADWPPDDVQPPWGDVTYLKMYDHPDYNYIAYNTIRMYETKLAVKKYEQKDLWEHILNIIPHYQKQFAIDGVMIDMGHALPHDLMRAIVKRARENNHDFAFWEENFALTKKSRKEGYNITMGYLWGEEHDTVKLHKFMEMLDEEGSPIPFFATPETHNTPRAAWRKGGTVFSRAALVLNSALPGVLFVHQGYELGEVTPVNTGLGFTPEDLKQYPSSELPLFSEAVLSWTNEEAFIPLLTNVIQLRRTWQDIICNGDPETFRFCDSDNPDVVCYVRTSEDKRRAIVIVVNLDCMKPREASIALPLLQREVLDQLSGRRWSKSGDSYTFFLQPGEGLFLTSAGDGESS
jgi:glycosidase